MIRDSNEQMKIFATDVDCNVSVMIRRCSIFSLIHWSSILVISVFFLGSDSASVFLRWISKCDFAALWDNTETIPGLEFILWIHTSGNYPVCLGDTSVIFWKKNSHPKTEIYGGSMGTQVISNLTSQLLSKNVL